MRTSFLPFAPPSIGEEEIFEVIECLRSGWITTGPRADRFEAEFASYVGAESALATSSGTAAIHTALTALGISRGDSVVLPTMTFSSVAHCVEHLGARPVFVDSEPETLNLDARAVERALSDQSVRCVLPVHLYGQSCDLYELAGLAHPRGIAIVDDAAHALPAAIGAQRIGSIHRKVGVRMLTAFSFYATKNLTTGEGGMLAGPRELIEEARHWSLHGMTRDAWKRYDEGGGWRYDVTRVGFKYNMADIQAALGLVQLRRLDEMHGRRREIAGKYSEGLASLESIERPIEQSGTTHAWHIYAIRLHLDRLTIGRDQFISELAKRRIGTSVHFIPVHTLTYYRERYGYKPDDFPVASREFERLISLPIHPRMTDRDVDDVIAAVADIVAGHRR